MKRTALTPYAPIGVFDAPPPPDAEIIGSINIGSSGVAHAVEYFSWFLRRVAFLSRFLPVPD